MYLYPETLRRNKPNTQSTHNNSYACCSKFRHQTWCHLHPGKPILWWSTGQCLMITEHCLLAYNVYGSLLFKHWVHSIYRYHGQMGRTGREGGGSPVGILCIKGTVTEHCWCFECCQSISTSSKSGIVKGEGHVPPAQIDGPLPIPPWRTLLY